MKSDLETQHFASDNYAAVGPGVGGARFMCSWDTDSEEVERFADDIEDIFFSISSDRTIIDE